MRQPPSPSAQNIATATNPDGISLQAGFHKLHLRQVDISVKLKTISVKLERHATAHTRLHVCSMCPEAVVNLLKQRKQISILELDSMMLCKLRAQFL